MMAIAMLSGPAIGVLSEGPLGLDGAVRVVNHDLRLTVRSLGHAQRAADDLLRRMARADHERSGIVNLTDGAASVAELPSRIRPSGGVAGPAEGGGLVDASGLEPTSRRVAPYARR